MNTSTVPDYAEFDDYVYTQRIAVSVRWFLIVIWLVLHNTRPNLDEGFFYINNALALTLAALNGYVHWRILKGRPVTRGYALALSLMDLSVITTGIGVSGRFGNHFFILYYPALLALALVFSSRRLSFGVTSLVAIAYAEISITMEPGLDFEAVQAQAERNLELERQAQAAELAAQEERSRIAREIYDASPSRSTP